MIEPGKRSSRRSVEVEVVVDCGVRRRRAQRPSSSTLEAEFAADKADLARDKVELEKDFAAFQRLAERVKKARAE